jgi:hypothetical protein
MPPLQGWKTCLRRSQGRRCALPLALTFHAFSVKTNHACYRRARFLYPLIKIVDLKADRTGAGASDAIQHSHNFPIRN